MLARAQTLIVEGRAAEALEELDRVAEGLSPKEARAALEVVDAILRADANDLQAHQRRVQLASKTGEHDEMVGSHLALAETLTRLGAETKAQAMFQRVLDLDPDNVAAREAIEGAAEPEPEEPVDLGAVLRDLEDEAEGEPDEDEAFDELLSQFRARSTEDVDPEDAGDHYDLGLAFKEMGLLDEAIAEFQTALQGGEERLKVYEELGRCFHLKGQFNVAVKVLNRALQMPYEDESELLGVYYQLGQSYEELGQRAEARDAYERVLSIDDSFADVPDRVARL